MHVRVEQLPLPVQPDLCQQFDGSVAGLPAAQAEVVAQRAKLDPNDIVGQQVLKDLLAQQQGLRDAISARALPEVNQARDAYNAAVAQYNGLCTRPRYSADEIAGKLGCARRTVFRRLDLIRRAWEGAGT